MGEQILALAMAVAGAGEEDRALLEPLCAAAETAWTARLREGVTAETCGSAFCCAAAFTSAADFMVSRSGGLREFKAGEISVKGRDGADAAEVAGALRQTAERLMAPYAAEAGFAFQGVRG